MVSPVGTGVDGSVQLRHLIDWLSATRVALAADGSYGRQPGLFGSLPYSSVSAPKVWR